MRGVPRNAVNQKLPIKGTNFTCADIANTDDVCKWCPLNYGVDMSKPGAQEYYNSVLELFAQWGVDFVKVDDVTAFPDEINAVIKAIENCDRDIVLSLSPRCEKFDEMIDTISKANMVRATGDIWDDWWGLIGPYRAMKDFGKYQKDGFWVDLDMIPIGRLTTWRTEEDVTNTLFNELLGGKGVARDSRFTKAQKQNFMTTRALAASPLMMGGHLTESDDYTFELITNKHMLECN
jgi:alpha-galactosidase